MWWVYFWKGWKFTPETYNDLINVNKLNEVVEIDFDDDSVDAV